MLRDDITQAIEAAPTQISDDLSYPAAKALQLFNTYLPADEAVTAITSASAAKDGPVNSVLAITDRRLVFVAPAPQAVAWRLSSLTRSQAYAGYFFVHGDAGEYSFGMASGQWADSFEERIKEAAAIAVLAGH